MISINVKGGKAQLQRATPGKHGMTVKVERITAWKPVKDLDMKKLEELVRMANLGRRVAFAKAFHMLGGAYEGR